MSETVFSTREAEDLLQIFRDTEIIEGTTSATGGVETAYTHALGRVPRGFIPFSQDNAGQLCNGSSTNTDSEIYIQSDAASTAFKIIVF